MVIQRILRHSNVSTTANYYIKTVAADVHDAMAKLENNIFENPQSILRHTFGTPNPVQGTLPESVN